MAAWLWLRVQPAIRSRLARRQATQPDRPQTLWKDNHCQHRLRGDRLYRYGDRSGGPGRERAITRLIARISGEFNCAGDALASLGSQRTLLPRDCPAGRLTRTATG